VTKRWHQPAALALLVWAATLLITGVMWQQSSQDSQRELQSDFEQGALDIRADIEAQLARHEAVLKSFVAMYDASVHITRQEFHSFHTSLVQGRAGYNFAAVNYLERVSASQLAQHQAHVWAAGVPDYSVHPTGARDWAAPIVYIEPMSADNRKALGFDPASLTQARLALLRAGDSGNIALTTRLALRQDVDKPSPAVSMYLPIYRHDTIVLATTPAERQATLVGWIGGSLRMADLMATVLPQGAGKIHLQVFDDINQGEGQLLFDSSTALQSASAATVAFQHTLALTFGGQVWTVVCRAGSDYGALAIRQKPQWVAVVGLLLSTLAALLTALLKLYASRRRRQVQQQIEQTRERVVEAARRETEQSLRDSEARWRFALQSVGDGLWEWNIADNSLYCSDSWKAVFGLQALDTDDALHRFSQRLHPDDRASTLMMLQDCLDGHTSAFRCEYRARCSDGSYKWILDRGQIMQRAPDGQPLRMVGTIHDITERKKTETNLRDSEFAARLALDRSTALAKKLEDQQAHLQVLVQQRTAELQNSLDSLVLQKESLDNALSLLNATLESTAYGILVVDRQGHSVRWNQRFVELWRMPLELLEMQGSAPRLAFAAAQLKHPELFITQVMALSNDPLAASNDLLELADGRIFKRISQPQIMGSEVLGRVWSFDDITDLKRAEAAALAANRAKSEFLANMSHEIRTPMNGVVGMVDVLQQTELQPAQARMLNTISQSSMALLGILNDILDYSKIEAGKLVVEHIPTRLTEVIQGVLQLLSCSAQAKAIDLSTEIDPTLPAWVMADPARLRQVLLNLVGNAIKFTPADADPQGRVRLRVEAATLPDGQPALHLRISDSGIGMSAEVLARLFQPFTQADTSTSREFGGTGLGLSISQRLVALMGGQLLVRSTPGQGSEFTVELPLQSAPAALQPAVLPDRRRFARASAQRREQTAASGQLLLLAEDNETNRDVLRQQLHLLGFPAEVACDGEEALAMWQSGRFTLLLTDCHMPKMDGFGLTRAIRQAEPAGQRAPIIAVTANAMQGERARCIDAGMDDYLAKPLRMEELRQTLARWLSLPPEPNTQPAAFDAGQHEPAEPPSMPMPGSESTAADPSLAAGSEFVAWNPATLGEMIGDNPAMQQRLLAKFLVNAHAQVANIDAAANAGDTSQMADVAHTLKSSARSVGALALGELCQQIETSGRAGQAQDCLALATALPDALAQAAEKIRAALV